MKIQSAKQKGKRFENYVAEQIREFGIDPRAGREIGSGNGRAKGDIRTSLDFLIEAKNQKKVSLFQWIRQAQSQSSRGYANKDKWALVIRDPDLPEFEGAVICIDFYQFLSLYKKSMEPKLVNPDRQANWALQNLQQAIKKVQKELNI